MLLLISFNIIVLLILLTSCTILKAEYPRHKIRGPPHGPRVPPSQQFAKKWHQLPQFPPRKPVRSRPIPVHMPQSHKIPMGVPQAPPRAVAAPVRTFWKNTLTSIKYPQEKPYTPPQEKPFLTSPSINTQEFDYHIQTNSIPTTHTNPIKQVGEKGPIHTIPAPNLSLRDKPIVVEELRYQQNTPYIKGDVYLSSQLNPKELYQLIGSAYPQQGVVPQIQTQEGQHSFYKPQQSPNYQALLSQQLFQPEQDFVQNLQTAETQVATDKISFQPEFHSFNYDEQAHQKNQKGLTHSEQISARNSLDPLAQAQLIQSYFDTRSDVEENDVEPDAQPGADQETQQDKIKEKLLSSSYFSSLPNKEAADRLAELQAAGKINSNLMKISSDNLQPKQSKDHMTILIPDDNEEETDENNSKDESNENYPENSKEQPIEYDDYSQEENINNASEEENQGFGHRVQPKKKYN
ncbi:hypothetical protein NQ314_019763 [Rhamnusium bicolor]|uniref:Uncharacterized protein n=1 Tax=Rhamnusium bicolor TaxID=1586634 RepID=A0AAV8WM17_9CUCU|nr:hypothetical protein NQ314_019763 [Rhamnusium bicolor]